MASKKTRLIIQSTTKRGCAPCLWSRLFFFFLWIKAYSKSCADQFVCATWLLFLSKFFIKFAIHIIWNWFCSCHGNTDDCDAETLLTASYENQDSALTQRQPLRTARGVCVLGRSDGASLSKEYISKKGYRVSRRFHHSFPVTGPGSVRGIVRQAKTLIYKNTAFS